MRFEKYNNEINYESDDNAPLMKKIGHAALYSKTDVY